MRAFLTGKDQTRPWSGPYARYDLLKELCVALGVISLLAIVLAILFSSPDEKPSTIAQWSRQEPINFLATAARELAGTSDTAEYGPPYNHSTGSPQRAAFVSPQEWLGVSHPIDTATDYVIEPLRTIPNDPALQRALAEYAAAPKSTRKAWAQAYAKPLEAYEEALEEQTAPPQGIAVSPSTGAVTVPASDSGPVPAMMASLLSLAKSGGLDGSLLTSSQFFQTDYTKPLMFMADGGLLARRAQSDHLLGDQWGMMNETGSFPGQVWLWLYTFWYQIEPFKASSNADLLVMMVMAVLSLAFVCVPLLPGVRDLPRRLPIHRLIWREHYAAQAAQPPPGERES